jgi:putative transposase
LCENIARAANDEDRSSGRFSGGRFKAVALLDDAALLACSLYVDLNPIRAGLAATPEESAYTSQGFLPIEVEHYTTLLDWTGRELRADKRGAIPDHLAPILDRLGLNRSNWVETVRGFGRMFKQAAGRSSSLVDAAARCSRHWFQGKSAARAAFV